jgi:hypothetical protein
MGDIFISCSRTDTDYAHKLAENLQSRGLHIWIDERLDDKAGRPSKLQKRLDSCGAFIVIMTPHSFASRRVQSELQHAKQKLKPIFPLWLEGTEPWFSGELTQYYDVRKDQWPEDQFYSALQQTVMPISATSLPQVLQETVQAKAPSGSTSPKSRWRAANLIVNLLAVALVLGAVTLMKPSGQKLLDPLMTLSNVEVAATPVGTLEPILVTRNYEISLCCGFPGRQRSGSLNFSVSVETVGPLKIEFNIDSNHRACSDLFLHVLWDNTEILNTDPIGPVSGKNSTGSIDLSSFTSQGTHSLTISPEGIAGGCNTGGLPSWMGKLTVHTSVYPK